MANSQTELIKAIVAKFEATNTFKTAIGGRLYLGELPSKIVSGSHKITTTYPCALFNIIAGKPIWYFDETNPDVSEEFLMQFTVFTKDANPVNLKTYVGYLIDLYDWCSLTMTSYTLMEMKRESVSNPFRIDEVWQQAVTYRIKIDKK